MTDPPYYDAIPYSDLMDFFYVWLRRTTHGQIPGVDEAFAEPTSPKWDHDANNGELIDDASRHAGDRDASKRAYEDGMARTFVACHAALEPHGRLVIVFAHKVPDAWETLVTAILRAGFVVDSAWPIATERSTRVRSISSAALSSSVWLVCKKRDPRARPGWDRDVLARMRARVEDRLRAYWDAGIRGPDFVWAATGPAMEVLLRPPGGQAGRRRGRDGRARLPRGGQKDGGRLRGRPRPPRARRRRRRRGARVAGPADLVLPAAPQRLRPRGGADRLGHPLRHRPAASPTPTSPGSTTCSEPARRPRPPRRTTDAADADDDGDGNGAEADEDASSSGGTSGGGGGSKVKLKGWKQRRSRHLGLAGPGGGPVPLIDRVHRLLHLWDAGDLAAVDADLERARPPQARAVQAAAAEPHRARGGGQRGAGPAGVALQPRRRQGRQAGEDAGAVHFGTIMNQPPPQRVHAYIDGFNLYFGLKALGNPRYHWLDLWLLLENCLKEGDELVGVSYFTARISAPEEKAGRQSLYLDALSAHRPLMRQVFGHYLQKPQQCWQCGHVRTHSEEKKTDVNIACRLMEGAMRDFCDKAIVVSGDSDLTPPMDLVRQHWPEKKVVVACPPKRRGKQICQHADAFFQISESKLRRSLLPRVVRDAAGRDLACPPEWSAQKKRPR